MDPSLYFEGIHGQPYQTWPIGNTDVPHVEDNYKGFCTHSSIVFLTWHRPYLSLFEVCGSKSLFSLSFDVSDLANIGKATLYKHVNDLANSLNPNSVDRAKYVAAAQNFRMPYWDWARKGVSIFPEVALHNIVASKASQSKGIAYNPLFQAPFPDGAPPEVTKVNQLDKQYKTTVRYPYDPKAEQTLVNMLEGFYQNPDSPTNPEKNLTERV